MYHGEPARPSGQTGEPDARMRIDLPSGKEIQFHAQWALLAIAAPIFVLGFRFDNRC
jgi:hypothetical protein